MRSAMGAHLRKAEEMDTAFCATLNAGAVGMTDFLLLFPFSTSSEFMVIGSVRYGASADFLESGHKLTRVASLKKPRQAHSLEHSLR